MHRIFPPTLMPTFLNPLWPKVSEFTKRTFQNLDMQQLFRSYDYLDPLESQLRKEINRTHVGVPLSGEIRHKSGGCWECVKSEQPAKLSWRRSGREKKSERGIERLGK